MENSTLLAILIPTVASLPALLFSLAYAILLIASTWKLFKGAGDKGWKALIPIYSDYTMLKLTWSKKIFWVIFILTIAAVLLPVIAVLMIILPPVLNGSVPSTTLQIPSTKAMIEPFIQGLKDYALKVLETFSANPVTLIIGGILLFLGYVACIVAAILRLISLWHLSKAYNHGFGYFAGLLFFHDIFYVATAFDGALTYKGNAYFRKHGTAEPERQPKEKKVAPAPATAPQPQQQAWQQPQQQTWQQPQPQVQPQPQTWQQPQPQPQPETWQQPAPQEPAWNAAPQPQTPAWAPAPETAAPADAFEATVTENANAFVSETAETATSEAEKLADEAAKEAERIVAEVNAEKPEG